MNYPEELREKWNECMYDERDIIEKFLKDQYDLRYGRQRDSWHLEPSVELHTTNAAIVRVTDIKLDNNKFVVFDVTSDMGHEGFWECTDFEYGELSKIIEALPDVNQMLIKNAVSDIARLCRECSVNLEEHPFNTKINGKMASVALVDYIDGRVVAYNHDGKVVSDEYACDFLVGLRDHINIEVLHRSNEYKKLMELLSLEPNLRKSVDGYDKTLYGLVTFMIDGTDIEFDVSAIQRDDKGNLTIFGADTSCEDELITLTEKEIRKEYLAEILKWMKPKYSDIIDTYNSHNAELVRKINAAWKSPKDHDRFGDILFAIGCRDKQEIMDKFDVVIDCNETAIDNAHEIMEGVCDDWDLETILSFIRYKED